VPELTSPRPGLTVQDPDAAGGRDRDAAASVERVAPANSLEAEADGGRPQVPIEVRSLIREMSLANRLWGTPRIHGELLNLG
jgi:hypothetical protein